MKRSPMPPRTSRLRSSPIARKRRTKQERDEKFKREYGSDERVEWVQGLICLVCEATPCENAHTRTGGMGRKANAETIVPLCAAHHRELHQTGAKSFDAKYRDRLIVPLTKWAEITENAWQHRRLGLTPLSSTISSVLAKLPNQGDDAA